MIEFETFIEGDEGEDKVILVQCEIDHTGERPYVYDVQAFYENGRSVEPHLIDLPNIVDKAVEQEQALREAFEESRREARLDFYND